MQRQPSGLSELGRFEDPAVLILTSLAPGPRHGYAIVKDVEEVAGLHSARARCTPPWPGWRLAD